jgi:hypothetical protein
MNAMPEREAEETRCCGPSHLVGRTLEDSTCIASCCMAWRWHDEWTSCTEEGVGGDLVMRLSRKKGEPRLGYCGLAGKP